MANRVESKGSPRYEEFKAGEASIYPGMLLKLNTSGNVVMHTTEGGRLGDEIIISAEDALQGNVKTTVFTNGAIVPCFMPKRGDVLNMLVEDGQNLSAGERVMSAGNGKIKSVDDIESGETLVVVIGVAESAIDLTGSNTPALGTIGPIRVT